MAVLTAVTAWATARGPAAEILGETA
jgi:hypothetical protein